MRPVGDVQLVLSAHASAFERVQLGEQLLRIEHHPIPDDAHRALENARWDLVQHEGLTLSRVHRVPGIGAALVAHDQIGALGQDVDHLPFALVAPLGADHNDTLRLRSEHERASLATKRAPRRGPNTRGHAPGSSEGSYPARSTRASPAATLAAPSSRTRSAVSPGRCTASIVRQLPLRIVTHSRLTRANAMPSTTTGNQRHRRAFKAVATATPIVPGLCTSATGVPRSSRPSRLITAASANRSARSTASARAPTRPNSSASGKMTPTAAAGPS